MWCYGFVGLLDWVFVLEHSLCDFVGPDFSIMG